MRPHREPASGSPGSECSSSSTHSSHFLGQRFPQSVEGAYLVACFPLAPSELEPSLLSHNHQVPCSFRNPCEESLRCQCRYCLSFPRALSAPAAGNTTRTRRTNTSPVRRWERFRGIVGPENRSGFTWPAQASGRGRRMLGCHAATPICVALLSTLIRRSLGTYPASRCLSAARSAGCRSGSLMAMKRSASMMIEPSCPPGLWKGHHLGSL